MKKLNTIIMKNSNNWMTQAYLSSKSALDKKKSIDNITMNRWTITLNIPQLRVRVRDGGSPRLSATAVVSVTVNRNLNAPVFSRSSYDTTILETLAPGSVVPFSTPISATDADIQVKSDINYMRPINIFDICC